MKEIIFYDSGIGGIALLNKTREFCKRENYVYFADNLNMPYGSKSEKEITSLVIRNLETVVKTTTKCIVIACNTITAKSISKIRKIFPETKIFGIEPEIKTALKPRIKNALLIATPQTADIAKSKIADIYAQKIMTNNAAESKIADIYSQNIITNNAAKSKIADIYSQNKITIHAAKTLARTIELQIDNKEAIYREIKKIKREHPQKFQALILGCTHYALVSDVFRYAFGDEVKIFDGLKGTAANISRSIEKEKKGFGSLKLIITKNGTKEKLKYASLIN